MRYGAFSIAGAKLRPFFELANFLALFFQKSFRRFLQQSIILLNYSRLKGQAEKADFFVFCPSEQKRRKKQLRSGVKT